MTDGRAFFFVVSKDGPPPLFPTFCYTKLRRVCGVGVRCGTQTRLTVTASLMAGVRRPGRIRAWSMICDCSHSSFGGRLIWKDGMEEARRKLIFGCCTVDHCRSQEASGRTVRCCSYLQAGRERCSDSLGSCLSSSLSLLAVSTCAQMEDCSPGTCIALHELQTHWPMVSGML